MSALDRLRNRMKRQGQSWVPPENKRTKFRLIGGYGKEDIEKAAEKGADLIKQGILGFSVHFGLPAPEGEDREKATYRCLQDYNEGCSICDFLDECRESENDKDLWKEHGRRQRFACHIYLIESKEIVKWYPKESAANNLFTIIEDDPDVASLTDGRTLIVTSVKTRKMWKGQPIFDHNVMPSADGPCALELDQAPSILSELAGSIVLSPKKMTRMVEKWFGSRSAE